MASFDLTAYARFLHAIYRHLHLDDHRTLKDFQTDHQKRSKAVNELFDFIIDRDFATGVSSSHMRTDELLGLDIASITTIHFNCAEINIDMYWLYQMFDIPEDKLFKATTNLAANTYNNTALWNKLFAEANIDVIIFYIDFFNKELSTTYFYHDGCSFSYVLLEQLYRRQIDVTTIRDLMRKLESYSCKFNVIDVAKRFDYLDYDRLYDFLDLVGSIETDVKADAVFIEVFNEKCSGIGVADAHDRLFQKLLSLFKPGYEFIIDILTYSFKRYSIRRHKHLEILIGVINQIVHAYPDVIQQIYRYKLMVDRIIALPAELDRSIYFILKRNILDNYMEYIFDGISWHEDDEAHFHTLGVKMYGMMYDITMTDFISKLEELLVSTNNPDKQRFMMSTISQACAHVVDRKIDPVKC